MFSYVFYLVRWLVILDYYTESFIRKFLFKTSYKIEGECSQCGKCCEVIGVVIPTYITNYKWILAIVITFYEKVNAFKFIEYSQGHKALLFSCNNFDKEKMVCTSYSRRPAICRSYPSARYFEKPVLLTDCTYKVSTKVIY